MKFDDQLAAYLYEFKTMRLEGIGTFILDGKVNIPSQQDKETYYPIEGLSFVYNPKSTSDEQIVTFLVQKLHKIEPLIRSDLEFYLANIRQFINLGKPYTIEGIGTLSKDNAGIYEFTPGNFLPEKEELNPKRENADHNYPVRSQFQIGRAFVYFILAIAGLALVGGIVWGIYYFISNHKQSPDEQALQIVTDSTNTINNDSLKTSNNTALNNTNANFLEAERRGDSVNYKMVFEVTPNRVRAVSRTAKLNQYGTKSQYDSVVINNATRYRLYVPARIRASDTLKVKRSLSKHLGKAITIVKN